VLYLHENTYPFTGVMDEYVDVMATDLIPGWPFDTAKPSFYPSCQGA